MKNLNRTIQRATIPKLNRKFLYSLCAALFLLSCSLSTKAQDGTISNPDTVVLGLNHISNQNEKYTSACTSCSPVTNDYGDATHSGPNRYIKITIVNDGYLSIYGGTSDFDSVFYLFAADQTTLLAFGDDGYGSPGFGYGPDPLQAGIDTFLGSGTYYLIVDGTDKYGQATSGTVEVYYHLN
ncbi:hypothetical protein [Mucilaginibacter sp. UYCu711]|uniref:hypothetical protein n=1 Tax=Mucilaginibacter sp. UYCu711 TaxID=3156339 RepID=UPI003D1A731A